MLNPKNFISALAFKDLLNDAIATGLLASETPKGPLSLRLPVDTLDALFPRLFPET